MTTYISITGLGQRSLCAEAKPCDHMYESHDRTYILEFISKKRQTELV